MPLSSSAMNLVATGLILGIVHVLTGPDHISALATLSSSPTPSGSPPTKGYLFGLGVRWGIGHSTGLVLVAGVFLARDAMASSSSSPGSEDGDDDSGSKPLMIPEELTQIFESLVGIFMILLGIYGIYEAWVIRYDKSGVNAEVAETDDGNNTEYNKSKNREKEGRDLGNESQEEIIEREADDEIDEPTEEDDDEGRPLMAPFELTTSSSEHTDSAASGNRAHLKASAFEHHHDDQHHQGCCGGNSGALALLAGTFHGLAGPGGILGVVPAIQLHDATLAACYLSSFCLSTMLTMGAFSAAYGTMTSALTRCVVSSSATSASNGDAASRRKRHQRAVLAVEFWIRCGSASLSILVGITWLILLAMGKLEEVFG